MVKLIIVRHGFSEYNRDKKYTGQSDIPLTEMGVLQAKLACDYLLANFKVDKIYSSDLSRAVDTAKPLAEKLGLEIITDARLRELDTGLWTDKTFEEVRNSFPQTSKLYRENIGRGRPDGGESYQELMMRAKNVFEEIANENEGKTIAVFTHGGVLRALYCAWNNISLDEVKNAKRFSNASTTVVEYENGKANYTLLDNTSYLDGLITEWIYP